MLKSILVYCYTDLRQTDELDFWKEVSENLKKRGYNLYLLASVIPDSQVSGLSYNNFWERLSFSENYFLPTLNAKNYDKEYFLNILRIERKWYSTNLNSNVLNAAFYIKDLYEILITELNPSLVVLGNGHHATDIILKDIVKKSGIPIVYIERGCLTKSWHLDTRGITAGSSLALKEFNFDNQEDTYLADTYIKDYFKNKPTWWKQPSNDEKTTIRKEYNIDANKKLILFLNQLDNDTSNMLYSPSFKSNIEAILWFSELLKREYCDSVLIVKKHPKLSYSLEKYLKDLENVIWIEDRDLYSCFTEVDLVCAVNSTALYEGLLHEKPVLQLGLSILSNKNIVYELKDKSDIQTVRDWFYRNDLDQKLKRYKHFLNHLILNELTFFSRTLKKQSFPGSEAFVQKLFSFFDEERLGNKPIKFEDRSRMILSRKLVTSMGFKTQLKIVKYVFANGITRLMERINF